MSLALAVFVVLTFAGILERLDLPGYAREVLGRASRCLDVLRDGSMVDDEKERRFRSEARRLFVLIGILGGGSALALLLPLGVVWLLDQTGVASLSGVLATLERVDFLAVTTLVALVGFLIYRGSGDS